MASLPSRARARPVWLLPIVLIVCAVMVAPAGALLTSTGSARAAHPTTEVTPPASGRPAPGGSGLPFSPRSGTVPAVPTGSTPSVPSSSFPSAQRLPSTVRPTLSEPWSPASRSSESAGYVPLVSPPNLGLVGRSAPASEITPGYQAPPAPLGLADYGVGAGGPYAYNTSHFLATVNLTSPPNVTAPSSEGVIDPNGSNLGLVGSPYEFSLQLNTIGTNITIPGFDNATVWAQNVLDINDSAIHFVDDVWNLTNNSSFLWSLNALASGCGLTNLTLLLEAEGGVYQCIGGSIAISPADYPLEIQLYNNASVTGRDDQIQFGYRIVGATGLVGTGIYDTIVFANPTGAAPADPVGFEVNGFTRAPVQPAGYPELLYDAEITFGGPIGGTNAVFRSLDGSVSLQFQNATGPWRSIPSAYNFGSDTGETAVGIAGYYTSAGTEQINQGPSFLYGLWGAPANVSVAAGDIQFQGTIDPTYGFVFVSNVYPGVNETNLSYVPTNASGVFDSYLPPAVPIGGSAYNTAVFAPGETEEIGANFSTSQSDYAFPAASPTSAIDAPLYMDGLAQGESLAANVSGWSGGPLVFANLVVNLPLAFTHLNDYAYPSFGIFQGEGLSDFFERLIVSNVTEGANVPGGELYTLDYAAPSGGWMTPAPVTVGPWLNYTEEINVFGSFVPVVENEAFEGSYYYGTPGTEGGVAFLFGDTFASLINISSDGGATGGSNIESYGTYAFDLTATGGGDALGDIGSNYTYALNVSSSGYYYDESSGRFVPSVGVYELSSWYGTLINLSAVDDSEAYVAGGAFGGGTSFGLFGSGDTFLLNVSSVFGGSIGNITFSERDVLVNATVGDDGEGIVLDRTADTSITNFSADEGWGIDLIDTNYTFLTNYTLVDWGVGSIWLAANFTFVTNLTIVDYFLGILGYLDQNTSFTNVLIIEPFDDGITFQGSNYTSFVNATIVDVYDDSAGVFLYSDNDSSFAGVSIGLLTQSSAGVAIVGGNHTALNDTNVSVVEDDSVGVFVEDSNATGLNGTNVASIASTAAGVALEFDANTTVTHTQVAWIASDADGFDVYASDHTSFAFTEAIDIEGFGLGILVNESNDTRFTATNVLDLGSEGAGVGVLASSNTSLVSTRIDSPTAPEVLGVVVAGSNATHFDNTTVLNLTSGSAGVLVLASNATTFNATAISRVVGGLGSAWGIYVGDGANATTFRNTFIGLTEDGIELDGTSNTTFDNTTISLTDLGVVVNESYSTTLDVTQVVDGEVGVEVENSTATTVTATNVTFSDTGIVVDRAVGTTLDGLFVSDGTAAGARLNEANDTYLHNISANDTLGVSISDSVEVAVLGVNATGPAGLGVGMVDVTDGYDVADVTATNGSVGVVIDPSSDLVVIDVTAADGSTGVGVLGSSNVTVSHVLATDGSEGVVAVGSSNVSVADTSAVNQSEGVEFIGTDHSTVRHVSASLDSVGAILLGSSNDSVAYGSADDLAAAAAALDSQNVSFFGLNASDLSVGAYADFSEFVRISDVTATNATLAPTWVGILGLEGIPISAVVTLETYETDVSGVSATNYPIALYDNLSGDLYVQGVSSTGGSEAVVLNGTQDSLLSGITADRDDVGVVVQDAVYDDGEETFYAEENVLTQSTFANDTGYGVALEYGAVDNLVYDNSFIGDNGAGSTYSATHIQAYSLTDENAFNDSAGLGNYWADWHTYVNGVLAPYYISNGAWDYHPIGAPEGTYAVTFTEAGLASGTSWSVTLNGSTQSTVGSSIVFDQLPGNYTFSVGALAGWSITPSHGAVEVTDAAQGVTVVFARLYTVTLEESGLASGTSWSAVFNGVENSSTTTAMTFAVTAGTYAYQVAPVSGYNASLTSGSVTVGGNYTLLVAFTPSLTSSGSYTVWLNETGLTSGTSWSAIFNGVQKTTTGTSLAFSVTPGTYDYQVGSVSGYTVSPASGSVAVRGNYAIAVAYTSTSKPVGPTYTVWLNETGLASGTSWTAVFNGVEKSTTGTSLAFTVTAGTYDYQVGSVSDYTVTPASGSATVAGNYTIVVTYTSTVAPPPATYTVWLNETGLASGTSWSAIFNGVEKSGTGPSLEFTVPAGTYSFQVGSVGNYTVSPSSGTVTVGANYAIAVTYTSTVAPPPATYTVWVNETGLASGTSWSAIFDGVAKTTTGASLVFTVPAGSYEWQVLAVSGYTTSTSTGTATVGHNYAVGVAFAPSSESTTTSSSGVAQSTFNTYVAIAIALGALAVVLALVALLRRPKAPAPATAWQEPAGPTPSPESSQGSSGGTGH